MLGNHEEPFFPFNTGRENNFRLILPQALGFIKVDAMLVKISHAFMGIVFKHLISTPTVHHLYTNYIPIQQFPMKTLIEKEKALHQPHIRTSAEQLKALLHPSFLEVGRDGDSFDLESIISLLEEEESSDFLIHSQDYQSSELAPDVYLLLYNSVQIDSDGSYNHYAKRSSIWVKDQNHWKMKYHQGTRCKPFPIENQS